ncbi:hypothetical protein Y032_0233g3089 [Ancylostoma ceylanicum]|nr:hypothetical protein Y032_0233g3089 [Ancylostoma ceylanicum]
MRALVVLLVLSAAILCRAVTGLPAFLRGVSDESRMEYTDLVQRWDLSATEKLQKILEWADKNGKKEAVTKYVEKKKTERIEQRKQFDGMLENLPTIGKKYESIWFDKNKTKAQKAAEMDKLRSEHKKEYTLLSIMMKMAEPRNRRSRRGRKGKKEKAKAQA